jgi:hypothetical protein
MSSHGYNRNSTHLHPEYSSRAGSGPPNRKSRPSYDSSVEKDGRIDVEYLQQTSRQSPTDTHGFRGLLALDCLEVIENRIQIFDKLNKQAILLETKASFRFLSLAAFHSLPSCPSSALNSSLTYHRMFAISTLIETVKHLPSMHLPS